MIIGIGSLHPQVGKSTAARYFVDSYGFRMVEFSDPVCCLASNIFGFDWTSWSQGDRSDPKKRKLLQDIGLAGKEFDPSIWVYYCLFIDYWTQMTNNEDFAYEDDMFNFRELKKFREDIEKRGIESLYDCVDFYGKKVDLGGMNLILGGMRSSAEADEILKLGGKVILIQRGEKEECHEVEGQLSGYDNFSHTIDNNGTFEEFYAKLDKIIGSTKRNKNEN